MGYNATLDYCTLKLMCHIFDKYAALVALNFEQIFDYILVHGLFSTPIKSNIFQTKTS